ncbi:MAG TPA: protein kinase [Solirubrobacterales bacterium]|nr:protein kinase [Solirubrobacterales bacterium]
MITREIRRGELFADRYRVIRRLGAGGMATVWLAEDERLGREVAVKRLRTDAPEESLRRFRREARIGATLNHPNFVSVFDTIATDEGALIVMEYVPGPSLEELMGQGAMDPEEAVSILEAAAAALDHAHREGVIHRDIKPGNILVREDGTVKLADLGIARAVGATQITAEGRVIGTATYMAPERFEAAGAGGPASDVYALAAVAYELLSGVRIDEVAPGGEHPPDRQALAANWPKAGAAAFAVVMRGLSHDPARRQDSAGEFVAELDDALRRADEQTMPFQAPTPSRRRTRPLATSPPRASRSGRSRAGAVLALTLVALAGLTAAGIALIGGGSNGDAGRKKVARAKGVAGPADQGGSQAAATDSSAAPPPATGGASSSPADGAALNAEGFSLINQGRPAEAVPVLRRAVESFPEGSSDLNYAYALYNLGNALRLSGHPEEAIPILERRLGILNQRSTVAAELARARADAETG